MHQSEIDMSHLDVMTGGDVALAREVLAIFRHQTELWGRLLDPASDNGQWADACHTIKGAARSIGAARLADACEAGEIRGREGDVGRSEASVLLSAIKDRMIETLEALAIVEHDLAQSEDFRSSNASSS